MSKIEKVVLDQFGEPWGFVHVDKNTREIDLFTDMTINGSPVNVKTRKVTANKRVVKRMNNNPNYEVFVPYKHGSSTYYRY